MIRFIMYIVLVSLIAVSAIMIYSSYNPIYNRIYYSCVTYRNIQFTYPSNGDIYIVEAQSLINPYGYYIPRSTFRTKDISESIRYVLITRVQNVQSPGQPPNIRIKECKIYLYTGNINYLQKYGSILNKDEFYIVMRVISNNTIMELPCGYNFIDNINKIMSIRRNVYIVKLIVIDGGVKLGDLNIYPSIRNSLKIYGITNETTLYDYLLAARENAPLRFYSDRILGFILAGIDNYVCCEIGTLISPTQQAFIRLGILYSITGVILSIDFRKNPENYQWLLKIFRRKRKVAYTS